MPERYPKKADRRVGFSARDPLLETPGQSAIPVRGVIPRQWDFLADPATIPAYGGLMPYLR